MILGGVLRGSVGFASGSGFGRSSFAIMVPRNMREANRQAILFIVSTLFLTSLYLFKETSICDHYLFSPANKLA